MHQGPLPLLDPLVPININQWWEAYQAGIAKKEQKKINKEMRLQRQMNNNAQAAIAHHRVFQDAREAVNDFQVNWRKWSKRFYLVTWEEILFSALPLSHRRGTQLLEQGLNG